MNKHEKFLNTLPAYDSSNYESIKLAVSQSSVANLSVDAAKEFKWLFDNLQDERDAAAYFNNFDATKFYDVLSEPDNHDQLVKYAATLNKLDTYFVTKPNLTNNGRKVLKMAIKYIERMKKRGVAP